MTATFATGLSLTSVAEVTTGAKLIGSGIGAPTATIAAALLALASFLTPLLVAGAVFAFYVPFIPLIFLPPCFSFFVLDDDHVEFPDSGKHTLTLNQIKQIPLLLSSPVMVFDSHHSNGSLVVAVETKDAKGKAVVIALYLDQKNARHQVNAIASLHGKAEEWFVKEAETGRLRYLDKQKSPDMLQSAALRLRLEEAFAEAHP